FSNNKSTHESDDGEYPELKANNIILKDNQNYSDKSKFRNAFTTCNNLYVINNSFYLNKNKSVENLHIIWDLNDDDPATKAYNSFIKKRNLQPIINLDPKQCKGEEFAKYLIKISEGIK
ncbi:hypothetical protein ACFL1H_07705, partial [Nanoarchaeota archaeon]